ncbi:HHR073Cp [Eremothecium sinecaudum]|uniref:HHR073Cp n=1 Tax=Eremothecium sinecaudum TaxID=45286 RepID=A0A0X8HWN1_9SACH|nr:HHR073Cp [Eremothecium sinecaudum]AMD22842.1 HHR073Cp [Eremothecium sinecaudum]
MGIPEESLERKRERQNALFARLDINGTGKVDLDTLQSALNLLDHPLRQNREAVECLFKALDWNKDSFVDIEDFRRYMDVAENQIKQGFEQIDKDSDGKICAEEISNYLEHARVAYVDGKTSNRFTQFIQWAFLQRKSPKTQVDSSNGYITYDQWRDFLLLMPRKQGSRLNTAYSYFYLFKEDVDLSSEGDMTLINDFIKGFGYFLAGGFAGVISRTCTAPLDRIKVFLIARTDLASTLLNSKESLVHHNPRADISKIRSPIIKAALSLYKQGGLRAFYVGNGLNAIKVFPESAIKFGSFELAKKLLAPLSGVKDPSELSRFNTYVAGGIGGIMAQFAAYPIDTLKFRIQCAPLSKTMKGTPLLMKTAKDIYLEGGLRAFYRGFLVGIMGVFPYAALDLGTFSALKAAYIKHQSTKLNINEDEVSLSNLVVLPMGAFSGTVGATVVYPINLLRTRLQAQGTFAHPHRYEGFRDVFVKTVQREGYQGLYKGLLPTLAKVCPAVSISYLCYENLKGLMKLE